MRCPTCVETGRRSRVAAGVTTSTSVFCQPFFDEDGRRHVHDTNVHATRHVCTRGHSFEVTERGHCWCGWSGGLTTTETLEGEQ